MKTKLLSLIIFYLFIYSSYSQEKQNDIGIQKQISDYVNFQLFPTPNVWTFIKLDTRNGKMWQVHFSINSDQFEGQVEINSLPLVDEGEDSKGRFILYKTENTYNLLLLDQIDGRVWQVQWNSEIAKRFISRIF